jgi:sterol desaturase/sphingolipid hydroxylase (fatty acid hydroxylase superfamily)
MENLWGLEYFIDANRRIFLIYLVSSFVLAGAYLYVKPTQKRINYSKKLWLHPSATLDYIYFFINNVIKVSLILPLIISAKEVAMYTISFLSEHFGLVRLDWPYFWVMTLFTLSVFVLSDFSRYWLHRWLHTLPFLWEFHKVHHSAKVLNPLTFYRVHPVENILFGLRYVFVIGMVTGVFVYLFGARIGLAEILGVNAFVFVFSFLGSNLRHSHIALAYPKIMEYGLISPKMHQIHHSTKHFNKNFGGYLAIWDYLFKTHLFSNQVQHMKFGLKKQQMQDYDSVFKLLFMPFFTLFQKHN